MGKKRRYLENFTGNFARIPHAVTDGNAFIGLTDHGKALLFALMRQHNGNNNGRLQLTNKWLAAHGWLSKSMNEKSINELIERGLIITTRLGGLNAGCNWYALTWLPISDYSKLDISANQYKQGCWVECQLPPTKRRKPPLQKQKKPPDYRDRPVPTTGVAKQFTVPTTGSRASISIRSTTPTTGNNVSMPYTPLKTNNGRKRIVGKSRTLDS